MGASVYSLRTSAVATTTTTWGAFATDGSWDLTIAASAGTVIEVGVSTMWAPAACYTYMDVGTIVSGSVVNWLSTGTGSHTDGVLSMFQENTNAYLPASGSTFYTVQSGDVVSGNVTLRLYGKTNTSTRDFALGGAPAHFWASVCDNGATTSSLSGTLSSSTFTVITGTVTVTASAGDTLACSLSGLVDNSSAGLVAFDAATMVSGSPVNWFSTGGSSHTGGVGAWRCNLGNYEPMTGTALYTVQSGDVVSGQVTVRIYGLNTSGSRVLVTGSSFTVRKV